MSEKARIIAFAGSAREGSYNKMLVKAAAAGADAAGAHVTFVDLRDLPMPIYDADAEGRDGAPENAKKLKRMMMESDGYLIASPENNSSLSALLKNAIDWVSRSLDGEPGTAAYRGKVAAIFAASPGTLGGLRGLVHLRGILTALGVLVLPAQKALPRAHEAFDDDGSLKDDKTRQSVEAIGAALADTIAKLKAPLAK